MNENKIINYLQVGKQEKAFARLYKYFPKVEKHILVNSGSKEEALDIFQDALVLLYQKVNAGDMKADTKIDGFLINSCKLLWSNELRKKKVRKGDDSGLGNIQNEDELDALDEKESKFKIVDQALQNLGIKCKKILELFYYKSLSMDEIAKEFGYKSVKSAKVQKYKCMESARKLALALRQAEDDTNQLNH
ncbi:MAG: RNA polymerase sigma factor (sigma-70 family) [Arenicella sp.]|jgi:RNA polymerase sigma factor (sigma-70 family)